MGVLPDKYKTSSNYINNSFFFILQIGKWAEDLGMSAKEICEVISNNKEYYKEVFDYYLPMKRKVAAYYRLKNPQYGQIDQKALKKMMGLK